MRAVTSEDAEGIARVQIDGWRATYVGIMPDEVLAKLNLESSAERWKGNIEGARSTTFVAVWDGEIVGFCSVGAARDDDVTEDTGELWAIYVHPNHWRRGVGRQLFDKAVAYAVDSGFSRLTLWMAAGNSVGEGFYRSVGFVPDGLEKSVPFAGKPIRELRFVLDNIPS